MSHDGHLPIGSVIAFIYNIKSMWASSVAVKSSLVNIHGAFNRVAHPIVNSTWRAIFSAIHNRKDFVLTPEGDVWLAWIWIEKHILQRTPMIIPYKDITTLVPGIDETRVTAFRIALQLGKVKHIRSISSTAVRKITTYNAYNKQTTETAIRNAYHAGLQIKDLMKEDKDMAHYIELLIKERKIFKTGGSVYRIYPQVSCIERFDQWDGCFNSYH